MSSGGNEDNAERAAVASVIFFIILFILYQYFFEYFVYAWKFLIIPILAVLKYLPGFITDTLFFWTDNPIKPSAEKAFAYVVNNSVDFFSVQKSRMGIVNDFVGYLIRPYVAVILLYQGYKILTKKVFKTKFTVDTLAISESKLWNQIKPIIFVHPEKEPDLNKGDWAMALRPEHFVTKHGLLESYETEEGDTRTFLKEEKAYNSFLAQMGKPWSGVETLKKEERQLYAIMVTKAARETKKAEELIALLATAHTSKRTGIIRGRMEKWTAAKQAEKAVAQAIKKYSEKPNVKAAIGSHFYTKTVLSALLEEARKDGVLATADFLWLKPLNRPLWYMLNNIGRRACWIECAGPWCHYWAEKLLERKVANPMIGDSVRALDEYLEYCSDEYDPINQEDEEEESEI